MELEDIFYRQSTGQWQWWMAEESNSNGILCGMESSHCGMESSHCGLRSSTGFKLLSVDEK